MRLRPHVIAALLRKDVMRMLRNGPALMLLSLFVVVAFLVSYSLSLIHISEPTRPY